jgi:hypothetical protein
MRTFTYRSTFLYESIPLHIIPGVSPPRLQSSLISLLSHEQYWARIYKRLWSPGIDSEESILPGWESISGLSLHIRALFLLYPHSSAVFIASPNL